MKSRTTQWAAIAATALAFVLFAPDLFADMPHAGPWCIALAKFAAIGGLAKFGIEAADARGPNNG